MTNEEAKAQIDQEHKQIGLQLENCINLLQEFSCCLKGEKIDYTGLGLWRIFCNNLEQIMKCRILTEDQWQYFIELQEKYNNLTK